MGVSLRGTVMLWSGAIGGVYAVCETASGATTCWTCETAMGGLATAMTGV